jgi:hypothetical protein
LSGVDKAKPRYREPTEAVAKAATWMPGEFAAVRNIFTEMSRRFGEDWLQNAQKEVNARSTNVDSEHTAAESLKVAQEDTEGPSSSFFQDVVEGSASSLVELSVVEVSDGLAPGLW